MVKCPKCKVDYVEAKCDFEYQGILFRNVKCERCPKCGDEVFTPSEYDILRARVKQFAPTLRLSRKISAAGKRPALYLPEDIIKATGLKIGDEVHIYLEGNRKIVIEAKTE